jgi:hypothetical protein
MGGGAGGRFLYRKDAKKKSKVAKEAGLGPSLKPLATLVFSFASLR